MSDLLVVVFDKEDDASNALKNFRSLEKAGQIHLEDTAVIYKDSAGKVRVKNELDSGVETGAVVGGILGGIVFLMFPVAGIALGAAAGAGVGALLGKGVDKKFVKEVSESLQPSTSALFLLISKGNKGTAVGALEPFQGKVYQTTFDPDFEKELKNALR
jgi:uncharacterized membrane protein